MSDRHPIVGAWQVGVEVGAAAGPVNLATFTSDGTITVAVPFPTAAAPGAGRRLEYWTPALGSWAPDGDRGATMRFVTLGSDETGAAIGTHAVSATVTVAADGQSWQGPFRIDILGADGKVQVSVAGTVTATPITASGATP